MLNRKIQVLREFIRPFFVKVLISKIKDVPVPFPSQPQVNVNWRAFFPTGQNNVDFIPPLGNETCGGGNRKVIAVTGTGFSGTAPAHHGLHGHDEFNGGWIILIRHPIQQSIEKLLWCIEHRTKIPRVLHTFGNLQFDVNQNILQALILFQ